MTNDELIKNDGSYKGHVPPYPIPAPFSAAAEMVSRTNSMEPQVFGECPPYPQPAPFAVSTKKLGSFTKAFKDVFESVFMPLTEAEKDDLTAAPAEMLPSGTKPSNPKDMAGMGKAPMSTVSQLVLAEVGVGMLEGALVYGRHNYREVGVLASIYFDAATRHLRSWWEGEDIDPKSQLSHVTKAITSLVVLRDAMIMGKFTDDRPPSLENVSEFFAALDARAAELVARDGHIKPVHYTNINKGE